MSFPNVIFVGAEKSGSTTIHHILSKHEDIFAIQKETEFFSFLNKKKLKDYHVNNLKKYHKLFEGSKKYKVKLDVSTTYLCSPDAIKNIKKYSKNCKIIICLRNPIDRAYSRYWMSAKKNYDLVNYSPKKFLKFFFEHKTDIYWSNVRLRGMYYKNVKTFIKEFGKSNVLILFYDDLKKNSNLFFKNIYNFLGIKHNILPNHKIYADSLYAKNKLIHSIFNVYSDKIPNNFFFNYLKIFYKFLRKNILKKYPKIGNYEKKKITDYYIDDIVQLEKLLKIDLSKWKS